MDIHFKRIYQHSAGQVIKFSPGAIPVPKECLITGDFNGYSPLWDNVQPTDQRGEEIENWTIKHQLSIANDGRNTRRNRATGSLSTPDVTLVGKKWNKKCVWHVGEQLGNLDHLPIERVVRTLTTHQPIFGKTPRCWQRFIESVEGKMTNFKREDNLTKRIKRFNTNLTKDSNIHVGKKKPKRNAKTYDSRSKNSTTKENRLRKNVRNQRAEWLEACKSE